jgi:hypothetical protein
MKHSESEYAMAFLSVLERIATALERAHPAWPELNGDTPETTKIPQPKPGE